MARASKRAGFGQQRGATSNRLSYNTVAPNLPKNGDRWIDKDTAQEYFWDKDSTQWIPLLGGYGGGGVTGLVYTDTDVVTTVTSLQTVAYVTASVERTASIIATACINGNASTTMTVTSYVMLNATTVNTIVETVELGDDHITNIDLVIEDVPAGTNDIWVQQTVNTGNWVLYASEQHLYALTYYDAVIGGDGGGGTTIGYLLSGDSSTGAPVRLQDTDEYVPDTWSNKTNMPSPARNLSSSSSISNAAYIYGGRSGAPILQDTDEYISDSWTSKTNMPSPSRSALASSTIGSAGYIYCGNSGSVTNDTDEYTPDTWSNKTNALANKAILAASTIGSAGYIYGGTNISALQSCEEYIPDTWTSKTNMPTPGRYALVSSTIGSAGYIYSGDSTGTYLQDTDEYLPDTWTSKTNTPSPGRFYATGSSIGSALYLYSGRASTGLLQDTDEYVPDTWTSKTDTPTPARWTSAGTSI